MTQTITAKTVLCAVIGNPIGHSLSPEIHNAAFRNLGLDWVYVALRVNNLKAAVAGIRALGIKGVSVTIPHKVAALPLLDSVEETAAKIGAINTIVNNDGRLQGINSDGPGALKALVDSGHDPSGRRVLILGSGGASRAIAFTLADRAVPARLAIGGILPDERAALCRDIASRTPVTPVEVSLSADTLKAEAARADIIMNCTPVGMHPNVTGSPIPLQMLRKGQVVFDVVYNPLKTQLLCYAEAAGAAAISGIEMFLNQAIIQFELWTGRPAPAPVMREVLMNKLAV